MAKKGKRFTKSCADCIHESACRVWTDGRPISDESASRCPNHETVNESAAYLCGVLDEQKRKRTNADRIRAMSEKELAEFLAKKFTDNEVARAEQKGDVLTATYLHELAYTWFKCWMQWLTAPAEEAERSGKDADNGTG